MSAQCDTASSVSDSTQEREARERKVALDKVLGVYSGHGKLEVLPKVSVERLEDLAALYTPGVGYLVKEILERPRALGELTWRDNAVAVISDGTAVLGLGNAGPFAALPVMEGKAAMFKMLVGIDAVPLCVRTTGAEELVRTLKALEPSFGGFNLEDVASPICFDVMAQAERELDVPAIHDDQYGTATVVIAALMNAAKVLDRNVSGQRVVVCGDGAAGTATVKLLLASGISNLCVVGLDGILSRNHSYSSPHRRYLADNTNVSGISGGLPEAVREADVFIGLSVGGVLSGDMVRTMAPKPIVFALANPVPEIMPEEALAAGAAIVATGRFDYPNQCNNVLAFPGLLRGALDTKSRRISPEVCLAAARAIAADVPQELMAPSNILPTPMSPSLYPAVAEAVARACIEQRLAREEPEPGFVARKTYALRDAVARRQSNLSALTEGAAREALGQ